MLKLSVRQPGLGGLDAAVWILFSSYFMKLFLLFFLKYALIVTKTTTDKNITRVLCFPHRWVKKESSLRTTLNFLFKGKKKKKK